MLRALLALVLLPSLAFSQAEEKLEIRNLGQCGLVTRYASSQIADTCLQEAENVYLDEDAGITRRKGFAKFNTTAITDTKSVRGVWPFRATDGTEYIVALSSETMFQSDGDGSFTAISPALAGKSSTQDMDCQQCLGKLWCVNGSDTMFFWDATSTGTVSGAPTCQAIDCFRNRIALSNCSGTLSQLRMSGELDGEDWTISASPVSTSPVAISIGGVNDGKKVQCIQGVYQDVLVVGKEDSTWGLYGFDRRDFAVREISREVGCIENRSGREKQGSLYWLSKRGVEKMTGPSITRVSDSIRDLVDTIIVAGGNSRSVTDTSQTDFEAGNLTASGPGAPMSASLTINSVVPSTWTISESTTEFNLGQMVNVSTHPGGFPTLIQGATAAFINAGGESLDSSINWLSNAFTNSADSSLFGSRLFLQSGSGITCPASVSLGVIDSDGAVFYSTSQTITDGLGATSLTIPTTGFPTAQAQITVTGSCSGFLCIAPGAVSVKFIPGTAISVRYKDGDSSSTCLPAWDIDESQMTTSGTYTTQRYNTGLSTPTWGAFTATVSSPAFSALTFQTQVSATSGGTLDAHENAPLGSDISSYGRQYILAVGSFSVVSTTNTPPSITDLSMSAATTGYFISQCRNPGTAITQWGLFQCNRALNGGDMSFAISVGTTCHGVTRATATWTAQTNNSVITVATAAYVAYRTLFDLDTATDTPTLNDCTINWNEGTTRPSVAAEVYRDRYYLAYTSGTTGTVANDRLLVLDSRDQWVLHDQPNCTSLGIYNRKMYCGDSGSTGRVYQVDIGQDDDGASFTSNFRTKDFDFGNTWQKKKLHRMYFDLAGLPSQDYSISLTPSYTLDASTDVVTLNAINLNEDYSRFLAPKVPADLSNNTTARWFNFSLSNSGSQGPWRVYGIKIIFSRLSED